MHSFVYLFIIFILEIVIGIRNNNRESMDRAANSCKFEIRRAFWIKMDTEKTIMKNSKEKNDERKEIKNSNQSEALPRSG